MIEKDLHAKQKERIIHHIDKILNLLDIEQPNMKSDVHFGSSSDSHRFVTLYDIYIHLALIKIVTHLNELGYKVGYIPLPISMLYAYLSINGNEIKLPNISYSWFKKVTKIKEKKYEF